MDKDEKELLDELKNFDINNLYQKGSYIDFFYHNCWTQGYILKVRNNNKYDISLMLSHNQIKCFDDISSQYFAFFGENSFKNACITRGMCFNKELYRMQAYQILQLFNIKLKKSNIELNFDLKEKKKNKNNNQGKENKIDDNRDNKKKEKEEKENNEIIKHEDNTHNLYKENNEEKNENNIPNDKENNGDNNNNKNDDKMEKENNIDNNIINENEKNKEMTKILSEQEKEENKNLGVSLSIISADTKTIESTNSSDNNNENNKENINIENKNNLIQNTLIKLDRNGNPINITGYYTFQFLGGFLLDCLVIINNELTSIDFDNCLNDLFCLSLDTMIYVSAYVRTNLGKLKSAIYNRKLTINSQLHAILASFELILNNITEFYQYNFSQYSEINEKFIFFSNMCYIILMESEKISAIPLQLLFSLIIFLTNEDVKDKIENFDENQVYKVFLRHIENLNESELKTIKSNELIKDYCKYIVNQIFEKPKMTNVNICYYTYLINCLKCNNLEKKMNALNDINEIIENISRFGKFDQNFFDFFVKKNKILDIFFEESIHEELLKRANIIFKYLAIFNKLSDEIIEKLIKMQKNDAMKNILCDIIPELPSDKINLIFNHLIKNLNFDENKSDIEYVTRLTESCFSSSNYNDEYRKLIEKYSKIGKEENKEEKDSAINKDDNNEENNFDNDNFQNYYGLTLLFDYIIKDFNDKKSFDKNNVNFAIEAFNRIIQFASNIESKDIYHFIDLLFHNIKTNEKHNSIIQSIIMIKRLISNLYCQNNGEYIINKLNNKYNVISLLVDDLIRYINTFPKEKTFEIHSKEIYEGIYPHILNIEERFDLIFIFVKGEYSNFRLRLKIESNHIEQLYRIFKQKQFQKEMQKLLNYLSRNLIYIENETIKSFYKDILLNPEEFDIINFSDLYTLNMIKDLFYKINHDNNMLTGYGKKLRVVGENIEGLDLLFDILINNRSTIIQREICHLLCDLFLNLKDYKSDFANKYWNFFIDKIITFFVKLNNENNINGLNGIINLIDIIYSKCCNFEGVIPIKEDTYQIDNDYETFQFYYDTKKKKDYKIRVGKIDDIYYMRWKLGYYYDIPVNNVVIKDIEGKKYSFINDNENFFEIFPPNVYSHDDSYEKIKVYNVRDILLTINNNPKVLIEENEIILKILIENLFPERNLTKEIKQKIYNIIKKMPKQYYINKNVKKFGQKVKVPDVIINQNLNFDNIYILSYFLRCLDYYIKNKDINYEDNSDKEEFLKNLIEIQNGENLLYNLLLESKIDYENLCYIQLECITEIINLLIHINKFKIKKNLNKKNYEYIFDKIGLDFLLKHLSEIIISILKIKYDEIINYNSITDNPDYKNIIISDSCQLLDTIINFIDEINNETKTYYLKYLLLNQNLFKEIFLFKYISCKENKLIEILHNFFIKNIFEDQHFIKIYLEIMLIQDVFKYIIENDTDGNYFKMLTSIMKQYHSKKKEKILLKGNTLEEKNNDLKIIINAKEDNNAKDKDIKYKEIKHNKIKDNDDIQDINKKLYGINDESNIEKNVNEIDKDNDNTIKNDEIIIEKNKNNISDEKNKINISDEKNKNNINDEKKMESNIKKKEFKIENKLIEIKKFNDEEEYDKNELEDKYINQFKKIIDLTIIHINYLYEQTLNKEDVLSFPIKKEIKENNNNNFKYNEKRKELIKNNKIEGIISFLQSILNISKEELIPYILSKVDIIDLFINKCILSKCNLNPLDSKPALCNYTSSQNSIFNLIIFILRNISNNNNNLYYDIINLLEKYHQIGFWKNNLSKNWELEISEPNKQKYIGLKNMTSTCYMNAILQQIFMIPMLRETLLNINNPDKKNVLFQLQLLFSALKLYESQYYDPSSFVLANKLNFYEQMDADEYFGMFIDKIENDIKNIYINEKENKYKDLFRLFFGIKALDELKFVDCGHKRYNEFFYNNIQLEVKGFNNLDNSLKNYFKTEIMDGENKINCEGCNMKRTCHKRQIFKSLPNILVVNLKRFEFDYNTMLKSKLNNYFEFPFELDLKEYLIEENQEINTTYELTGITIHFGFSDYGHYYDLIKSPNGKWYKFNDNCVYEFDEKDIPQEAFGEKESEDDFLKDIEEKDSGQNNAYILIYKKKIFDFASIENISKNYNCNLVLPPYDKYTNINDEIKSIINKQMFKFWTLQSIISAGYQNFVINLLKIDLVQNIITKKTENMHHQLFNNLKEEGYIISNKVDKIKNTNNKIFEFGLKYFFNIVLRIAIKPKDNLYLPIFSEIIKLYIESDLNKAKFILEEFSNSDIINEFLVYCCIKSGIMATHDIIYFSFKKLFDNIFLNSKEKGEEINDDLNFLFKFINTYVLFISYNIHTINIENVNSIFYKILKISSLFINYLKDKKLEKWIMSFYADDDEDEDENIYLNAILSEDVFPKLKSNHKILTEKKMIFDGVNLDDNESENEFDTQNINRLKDTSGNSHLIRKLYYDFNVE